LKNIDARAFSQELSQLHSELVRDLNYDDFRELRRMAYCGKAATVLGYATAWLVPNPVSAFLINQGILTRWMLMHHISHRGYDKIPGVPARYTSAKFAKGARRWIDWFDWIIPEAWAYEHNVLHHYHTGESKDPDLIEQNMEPILASGMPKWGRYLFALGLAFTWKFTYYAPKTLLELQRARAKREGVVDSEMSFAILANPFSKTGWEFWSRCFVPYSVMRFVALPALFLPLGWKAALFVLINTVLAEAITNFHSFLIVGPNHSGPDIYRFDGPAAGKDQFYLRQAFGSVNYTGGTFLSDYLQAGLNYQIEHHFWPDMPMTKYREAQARAEAICKKHGVLYIRESVFKRARALADILVGNTRMLKAEASASSARAKAPAADSVATA
jgi:fatty acid desaturase